MRQFQADTEQLTANATANAEHAKKLRTWIDQYDNPARYEQLAASLGTIAHPVVEALRRHGAAVRQRTTALIDNYEHAGTASQVSATRITNTDELNSAGVRSTVEGL